MGLLTSYWSTITSGVPASSVAAAGQTMSADVLSSWPLASQVNYLRANGSGSPPTLLMPSAQTGGQVLMSLAPGSNVVQFTDAPTDFLANLSLPTADPDPVTLAAFEAWPDEIQTYYLTNKGTGSPPSLNFTDDVNVDTTADLSSRTVSATLTSDGTGVTLTSSAAYLQADSGVTSTTTPLSALQFFSLPPDQQSQYFSSQLIQANLSFQNSIIHPNLSNFGQINVPPIINDHTLNFSSDPNPAATISLSSRGVDFKVAISAIDFPGFQQSPPPTSATFSAWPPQVQTAFMSKFGLPLSTSGSSGTTYPKTVVFDGGGTALLSSADASVDLVANPPGFANGLTNPSSVSPSAFLGWPYASQLALLRAQPTGTSVTLGSDPNRMTAALDPDASGFQVAMASDPTSVTSPSTIDFQLYSKVASPDLQAKLLATFADPGSSPPIVTVDQVAEGASAPATYVISGGSATTGQGLTIEQAPTGFTSPPSAVKPETLLSWSPAVRQSYLLQNKAAFDASGTLTIGSGTDTVTASFSGTNGTMRIVIPQTLADVDQGTRLVGSNIPYYTLPGSAVGVTSAINDATASALFPVLDGSGGASDIVMSAGQQQQFALSPPRLSATVFSGWPTALQLQYLRAYQSPGQPLTIGSGSDSLDAFRQTTTAPGTVPMVYVVQNLQKNDIGQMSYPDQLTLAKSAAFISIAAGLGLIPDDGTTAALTGSDTPDPNAGLSTASTGTPTLSAFGFVQTMFVTALNTLADPTKVSPTALPNGAMPAADLQVFVDEVDLLRQQTFGSPVPVTQGGQATGQAIYSPKDIQDKLTAIVQRFTRANAFSTVANAPASTSLATTSTDGGATIKQGYQTFMTQEKSILDLANRTQQLSVSDKIGGTQQNLDVPNLVYLFMMYANLTGEATLRADTEEVNQTNDLLNEYAVMQKVLNDTAAAIAPDSNGSPGSGALVGSGSNNSFTDADKAALAMFSDASTGALLNPIELLQTGFARPSFDTSTGNSKSSSQWSAYGTALSDAVTQLNQASQLKMNDINAETKQKDREFDLANTALGKMSDIVTKIASTS